MVISRRIHKHRHFNRNNSRLLANRKVILQMKTALFCVCILDAYMITSTNINRLKELNYTKHALFCFSWGTQRLLGKKDNYRTHIYRKWKIWTG